VEFKIAAAFELRNKFTLPANKIVDGDNSSARIEQAANEGLRYKTRPTCYNTDLISQDMILRQGTTV